eukprot:TRINITY_DN6622_c0_g1_i2.p1 TRINITY_DN6622_c0_g1~~TRINITY_DN6622_c0_g1_i2.p1  ORF type:complete len:588 (-),score=142.04 TRINITY_DN6622_c0_g1_i2:598-2361(-)
MSDNSSSEDELPDLVREAGEGARAASEDDDLSSSEDEFEECKVKDEDQDDEEENYINSSMPALDLFSKKTFPTAEECISYCKDVHGLDLSVLKKRHNMDFFSFIRFVNYVRTELPSPGFVMSLSSASKWEDAKFMKPVIPDDPILMYNFEDDDQACIEEEEENGDYEIDISRDLNDQIENPALAARAQSQVLAADGGPLRREGSLSKEPLQEELEEKIRMLQKELEEKQTELINCQQDMIKMREAAQNLFCGIEESTRQKLGTMSVSEQKTVEEDQGYFQSYAHYSIHHEMLSDTVRTQSYRDALLHNKETIKGSKVLDIGCGTGILSMFAAEAGAEKVVGVDCSDIIYQAMDIVRENKLTEKVELVKGRLEETKLPVEKFNYIISEWMGYFLLYEGMLDSVIAARDKLLAEGGMILPNRCTISMVALSDPARYSRLISFWENVYGYKMTCMRNPILEEANVEIVPGEAVASAPATVLDLDINTCTVEDTEFKASFDLAMTKDCDVTAIVGYFDIFFDLPNGVMFSTGPEASPTHWKQTVFYLPKPMAIKQGDVIKCKIVCKRMKSDARALKVSLTVNDLVLKYTVD